MTTAANIAKLAYLPRFEKGTRNVTARLNRKIIFAAGNWFFPRSRLSLGIWVLESYAKKRNLLWKEDVPTLGSSIDLPEIVLMRPETYSIEDNGRSFAAAAEAFKMPFDRMIVLHHDQERELGDIELKFGGPTQKNDALRSIFEITGTESFPRLSVGIGHPDSKMTQAHYLPIWNWSDNDVRDWFAMNKFPPRERMMVRELVIPRVIEMMEFALSIQSRDDYYRHMPMTYEKLENEFLKLHDGVWPTEDEDDAIALVRRANLERERAKVVPAPLPPEATLRPPAS